MSGTDSVCAVCGEAITLQSVEDVKRVIVDAHRTVSAHWRCAKDLPLCPVHRQRFLGELCPRCARDLHGV